MAENNSDKNTFRRRKLIEDMAPQRRLESQNEESITSLKDISENLKDVQAATEIVAETVEEKSNEIITTMQDGNKTLADVVAGTELAAEASERTTSAINSLNDVTTRMSDKLERLSDMLAEKMELSGTHKGVSESTSLAAIKEAMPIQVEQPNLKELIEKLIPQHNIPTEDAPFLPSPTTPQQETQNRDKKDKKENSLSSGIAGLTKISKAGFRGVLGVADKIAGMLLSMTVSAALQAAKTAAMVLAIVMGIDQIKVYFDYIQREFKENFAGFFQKFEEWGTTFQSIVTAVDNIKNAWSEGNFMKLAWAIIKGIGRATTEMVEIMMKGMSTLVATALRKFGFDDAADTTEYRALQGFQMRTGNAMTEEEQDRLAELQDKQNAKDIEDYKDDKKDYDKKVRKGKLTQQEADAELFEKYGVINEEFQALPKEERLKQIKERNNTQAEIKRLTTIVEDTDNMDDQTRKDVLAAKDKLDSKLAANDYEAMPALKSINQSQADLNKLIDQKLKPELKSAPVETKEETQAVQRVEAATAAKNAVNMPPTQMATVNQTNTRISSSKTMYNIPPTSATPAPGMGQSTRLN